jgi:hypothetical protein
VTVGLRVTKTFLPKTQICGELCGHFLGLGLMSYSCREVQYTTCAV